MNKRKALSQTLTLMCLMLLMFAGGCKKKATPKVASLRGPSLSKA